MPTSDVLFLGFCERAQFDEALLRWNVLGLSTAFVTPVLPARIPSILAVAFDARADLSFKLSYRDAEDVEYGTFDLIGEKTTPPTSADDFTDTQMPTMKLALHDSWVFACVSGTNGNNVAINKPGLFKVFSVQDDKKTEVGQFEVHVLPPRAPLTSEEIAAIKSDPRAAKLIKGDMGCLHCSAKLRYYLGLDRNPKLESDGWLWLPEISEPSWTCSCGKTKNDLSYLKGGLAHYLGQPVFKDADLASVPMFEISALRTLRSRFIRLLDENPSEEKVQQFITKNPVLLHQFVARTLMPKPPIGTKYRADFAILDANHDLTLIELESPKMNLLRKNGHRTSGLTHALDQIGDWLREIAEHRAAILDGMGLKSDQVNKIRGVLIAGRDRGHDAGHLRALRMRANDNHLFMTYDDLLESLDILIGRMQSI